MELWASRIPEAGRAEQQAERAEAAGWDGITFTDSQNLIADPFIAIALAAKVTERLKFATGVTNVATRDPAALATVAATVQETSGGRMVLGVGRGDTALFHLGRKPQPVVAFAERLAQVQAYLGGETVDREGHPSRLQWLSRATQPKVPLDVAASGPKVIAVSARIAERITFAVGADPDRLRWAMGLAHDAAVDAGRDPDSLTFGAYVNVGCHPDVDVARGLIGGAVAAFAHFSAMPGSAGDRGLRDADRAVVEEVGRRYDSNVHLRNDADHAAALDADFVDRFAVVGPPDVCIERLAGLGDLGLQHLILTGPSFGADPEQARLSIRLLTDEVRPAVQSAHR